jgi:hypothetical protein
MYTSHRCAAIKGLICYLSKDYLENSKPETRNPKQILNSNVPMTKTIIVYYIIKVKILFGPLEFLSFGFVSDFGIRYSDLIIKHPQIITASFSKSIQ